MCIVKHLVGEIGEEIIEFLLDQIFNRLPGWLQFAILAAGFLFFAGIIVAFFAVYVK